MSAPRVSVVMPAFNEAEILATSVKTVVDGLRARREAFELIIVENGSTDDHACDRDEIAAEFPEVRVEHRDEADYGRALRAGLLAATRRGRRQLRHRLLRPRLPRRGRRAGARRPTVPRSSSGSKRGEGATDTRDPLRKLATLVFSTMLRVGFGLHVSDTHGMKAMRRAAVEPYARICNSGQDLFDTELILRVERAGLRPPRSRWTSTSCARHAARSSPRVPRTLLGCGKLRCALWKESRAADARRGAHPQRRGRAVGLARHGW